MYFLKPDHKRVFFQGNSLLDTNLNHTVNNQKYVTRAIYDNLRGLHSGLAMFDYSISGQNMQQIVELMESQFYADNINENDVVFVMEGTNYFKHFPEATAQDGLDLMAEFVAHVSQFTNKIIVGTTIARNHSSDDASVMTRINSYNAGLRLVYTGNNICDLGARAEFDTAEKCSNTTYYDSDKLHLVSGGQAIFISDIGTAINNLL